METQTGINTPNGTTNAVDARYRLTAAEQETSLNMAADNRGEWDVCSADAVMQRRLERAGAVCYREDGYGTKWYKLPAAAVSIRKPRELSDEQRAAMAARARAQFGKES